MLSTYNLINISNYLLWLMAMAISYNWLFLWDYTCYFYGVILVLITGITRAKTVWFMKQQIYLGKKHHLEATMIQNGAQKKRPRSAAEHGCG